MLCWRSTNRIDRQNQEVPPMSQVTESTKDQVALPEITVDSIMDAVSQEMTQQGNKTLASFWAKMPTGSINPR